MLFKYHFKMVRIDVEMGYLSYQYKVTFTLP